ncbi:MAG: RlmE family RNA methyltransferase [Bdellovibrionales bacterium]|nr:RlmE family RNA methyltransferase [Bdellovibrionales bacterium]
MAYNRKDFYFHEAKKQNYAARSAFKLEEIDARFRILKAGDRVLDLGAAPGSWSQYASKKIGPKGRLAGVDLDPVRVSLPNATFLQEDIRTLNFEVFFRKAGLTPPFDAVLSDMAPRTTGIKVTDQARSLELCELALATAEKFLRKKGHFVCKLFHSEDFEGFRAKLRARFDKVEVLRPKSTRKESKEIFLISIGHKNEPTEAGSG